MLKELRELLPEAKITKDGMLYDVYRDGLHIPVIAPNNAEEVAKSIRQTWSERC